MHRRFSKTLFTLTLALLSYGCTERFDLAPVRSEDQRFDGKYRDDAVAPPQTTGNHRKPPAIESPLANRPSPLPDNYRKPVAAPPKKKQRETPSVQAATKYHVVKAGETLYSIGARSGYSFENLARWNRIEPPYPIESGQKLRLFNPGADEKAGISINRSNTAVAAQNGDPVNKSINSIHHKIPAEKKTAAKHINAENHNQSKKKSVISIDNKNMLMLNFQWPIKGKVRKNFSQTDKKGIDIVGDIGQTVRAAEAGKVVYSGQGLIGFGNLLIIKHNDEYLSAYANNGSLFVKEGEHVTKGQGIAKAGVAVSKKALLHFEIRKNGKSLNPLPLLPKK